MKLRAGFVSNSSTTSFSLYGAHIGYDRYDKYAGLKAVRKMRKKDPEKFERFMELLERRYSYIKDDEDSFLALLRKDANDLDSKERTALEEALEYDICDFGEALLGFLAKEEGVFDDQLQIWALPFNGIYMGWHWDTMDDSETLGHFKQSVQDRLKKVFGKSLACGSHDGEWSTEP